jgi:outer membrane protein assembly factor BamB
LASALAPLLMAACGGDVRSTKETGDPPGEPGPKAEPATSDWNMLGYDLASTYWNKVETKVTKSKASALVEAWEFDTGSTVTATPVVSGGRVYVASAPIDPSKPAGGVIAIDLATGTMIWRNMSVGGYASLAVDKGVLYHHDPGGIVRALDAADGRVLWEHKTDEHPSLIGFSSPIVTRDFVLVGGASNDETVVPRGEQSSFRGFVIALNKADGSLAWKKYTVEPPHNGAAIWSTLSADETTGVVVAATGNNYTGEASPTSDAFLTLPLANGQDFLWTRQILEGDVFTITQTNRNPEADFGANPILFEVQGRKLAAGGNKGGDVWVLDRADGSIVQRRNLSAPSSFKGGVFNSGAWDGKSLLFVVNGATSSGAGSEAAQPDEVAALFALDPLTLEINWERQIEGPAFSPISVANGVGFFGKNKTLQAFDTSTGKVLFEFPSDGTIATAPAVSNGYVVFGSGMSWISATAGTKYYALKVP